MNKKKIFSAIGGYYQGLAKGSGLIYFYVIPNDEIEIEKINDIVQSEIQSIIKKGLNKKRFEIEKKKYLFDSIYELDGILNPAQIIGEAIKSGLKVEDVLDWNRVLKEISVADVQRALEEFQNNKNYVIGELKK